MYIVCMVNNYLDCFWTITNTEFTFKCHSNKRITDMTQIVTIYVYIFNTRGFLLEFKSVQDETSNSHSNHLIQSRTIYIGNGWWWWWE